MPAAQFTLALNWLQVKTTHGSGAHAFLHALSPRYQFTECVRRGPRDSTGSLTDAACYLATRGWVICLVRVADFMPPNVHQFTREIEDATEVKPAAGR